MGVAECAVANRDMAGNGHNGLIVSQLLFEIHQSPDRIACPVRPRAIHIVKIVILHQFGTIDKDIGFVRLRATPSLIDTTQFARLVTGNFVGPGIHVKGFHPGQFGVGNGLV